MYFPSTCETNFLSILINIPVRLVFNSFFKINFIDMTNTLYVLLNYWINLLIFLYVLQLNYRTFLS